MRLGGVFSLVFHLALLWGGVTIAPALIDDAEPVPVFDIDLVTIAEETNLKAAAAELEEEIEPEEVPPPAPEPEEVPIPEEAAPPPPKPEPPKPKEPDFQSELDKILNAASKAEPAPAKKESKPANPFGDPTRNRQAVGEGTGSTVRIEQYIMRQLLDNDCWGDQETLADSQNMAATISVRFGRDGRFSEEPKLIQPARMPPQGPFLVYITRAFAGLNKCNNIGFKVPEEYFTTMKSPYIALNFKP